MGLISRLRGRKASAGPAHPPVNKTVPDRTQRTGKVYIVEIQKLSTEDGPGIRTTVFFKSCPMKCTWCQNPETLERKLAIQWFKEKCIGCRSCIDACPNDALTMDEKGIHIDREKCQACGTCVDACPATAMKAFGEWWTVEALYNEVNKDRIYYEKSGGGVTVSGGEPMLQPEWVAKFLKLLKDNGIATALDTCGHVPQEAYEKVLPFVDLVLYDIKEIDPERHKRFTGVTNERLLANAIWLTKKLNSAGKQIWIRTPIIPRYTATDENVRGIARFIVEKLGNRVARWDLLAFNVLPGAKYDRMDLEWEFKNDKLFTKEEMEHFHAVAVEAGVKNVQWSGLTRKTE